MASLPAWTHCPAKNSALDLKMGGVLILDSEECKVLSLVWRFEIEDGEVLSMGLRFEGLRTEFEF